MIGCCGTSNSYACDHTTVKDLLFCHLDSKLLQRLDEKHVTAECPAHHNPVGPTAAFSLILVTTRTKLPTYHPILCGHRSSPTLESDAELSIACHG